MKYYRPRAPHLRKYRYHSVALRKAPWRPQTLVEEVQGKRVSKEQRPLAAGRTKAPQYINLNSTVATLGYWQRVFTGIDGLVAG